MAVKRIQFNVDSKDKKGWKGWKVLAATHPLLSLMLRLDILEKGCCTPLIVAAHTNKIINKKRELRFRVFPNFIIFGDWEVQVFNHNTIECNTKNPIIKLTF